MKIERKISEMEILKVFRDLNLDDASKRDRFLKLPELGDWEYGKKEKEIHENQDTWNNTGTRPSENGNA